MTPYVLLLCAGLVTLAAAEPSQILEECWKQDVSSWAYRYHEQRVNVLETGTATSMTVESEHYDDESLCKMNETFGFTETKLWVSHGCRATFTVCYNQAYTFDAKLNAMMDHFRTLEIESRAQRVKVEGLEWNKQTIEAEMAEVRQELMNMKQDKQKADVEIAGIKQELKDIHQDKLTPDVEIAGIKQELVEMKKNKQTMDVEITGIKQEVLEMEQDKQTVEVEMARIKQELDDLKKRPMAMNNQIRNSINGLEQTTVKLTNQLTTMHTEQASSYSALSRSINNTRHIETGTLYCGDLSPGATEPVTTKFSSPYTGAPPTVYVSAGPFSIRVTTDTSKYIKLRGYLGHVDVEGFTFTCKTYSDSSDVDYQHMQWISFPTVL